MTAPATAITLPEVRLPAAFISEFAMDGRTPMRALSDEMIVAGARELSRHFHSMLELGSGGDYYKAMLAGIMPVSTSNIVPGAADHVLDMTALALPDASQPLLMSAFAIEHFFEVDRSISEAARVLQPGGAYFLVAPFLYYYHAAPDDYFRFTGSALRALADKHGLVTESTVSLGDRWLMFAEFLHEKAVLGSSHGPLARFAMRMLALPMLAFSVLRGRPDSRFAMGYAVLLRKPLEDRG
jgi:hypothetical protein